MSCIFIALVGAIVKLSYAFGNGEDRGGWLNTNEDLTDLKVDEDMELETSYIKYISRKWFK